jgi:PAS domain S-box-containing protein
MYLEGWGMPMQDTGKTKARLLEELEALRLSEARYRAIVEHIPAVVYTAALDQTSTTLYMSPQVGRFLGYSPDEWIADHELWVKLVHPDDRDRVLAQLADSQKSGNPFCCEYRMCNPDGRTLCIRDEAVVVKDNAGRPVFLEGVMLDITDRVLAEEALRESEQRYRTLFEQSLDAIAIVADGRVVHANEAAAALVGVALEVALGRPIEEFVHADDRPRVRERVAQLAAGALPSFAEQYRTVRLDGSVSWVEVRGQPIEWEGRPAAQIVAHDVTERRAAEEALRKSEGEKDLILSSVAEEVLFQDTRHRILWANRAAAESVGATPDQLVGRPCYTVFHPRTEPCPGCPVHKALETGEPGVAELRSEDGRYWFIKGYPIRDAEENIAGAVEVALDITEQRRAEEERRRLEARVRDAQKLESLGVLAGGIAHDFNNLLVGILGNVGLAHLEMPPDSPLRPYCEQIEQAAFRARDLTNQLLAFAGKGKFQIVAANLSDLVRDTADLLRVSIPRRVALDLHLAPDLPPILADATQIRQVVMNLLTNASEAVGDSPGTITLVTGSVHADRAYLAGAFVDEDIPEGDYVFLDVSDTGSGMDAETRAKIFDPFFSTKFSGRGLGLAAVLGIVRGHRGAVRVYSEPGQGTAVKVLFPAAEKGTAVPHRPSEEAPAPRDADFRGSGTVLVIDDEPSVRDVARAILERAGFEVLVAASGREGLERFRAGADRIVAVLLDMTMPDFSGEEVFAELRSIRPGVPVILSSGYNEQDATRRFAPAGLAGFIQKPYLPADLLSKVRAALRV